MDNKKLQFKDGNPGAVQYGNFINYYKFHPPEERLMLLPKPIWNNKMPCVALDIGCNAGDLTVGLYKFLKDNKVSDCSILGIDIDPVLIKRAEENNNNDNISFKCLDIMDDDSREAIIKSYLRNKDIDKFNIVFCFSTTMWIHLNNGDIGLKKFLNEISRLCELLVIEPQPFKCYKNAVKRMKPSNFTFSLFGELNIRENVVEEIENYLSKECNFKKTYESNKTKWDRKLLFFEKCIHNYLSNKK